jgi:hypothetical protein
MSSKPAIIRQRDVTRILKGAAAAGVVWGLVVRDGEARFVPVDELKAANEPSALDAWEASQNARKAGGRA